MVLKDALDKAKEGSKEDKTAIAGGIAFLVVIILVVAWGVLFLKKVQRGAQTVDLRSGVQDEFNFSTVREAQRAIQDSFHYTDDELQAVRQAAVERSLPSNVQGFDGPAPSEPTDQFGNFFD